MVQDMASDTDALSLHPLNRDFVWQDAPLYGLSRLAEAQVRQYNEQGFFRLENAFNAREIEAVAAAIDPLDEEYAARLRSAGSAERIAAADAITFTTHLVKRSPVLKAFAAHPVFRDICLDLIGPGARLYWDQSVYKKSGRPQEFPWHQDNGYTFLLPQHYVTCWMPLVDVDETNGCPWIAPGLHRLGTLSHWRTPLGLKCLEQDPAAIAVPAKAGGLIVFSSLAPHRTGPNLRVDHVRKAYILQYAPDGAVAYPAGQPPQLQDDPARQFKIGDG